MTNYVNYGKILTYEYYIFTEKFAPLPLVELLKKGEKMNLRRKHLITKKMRLLIGGIVGILALVCAGVVFKVKTENLFNYGTMINNIDCSFLSIEEAIDKVNGDMKAVTFFVVTPEEKKVEYSPSPKDFVVTVDTGLVRKAFQIQKELGAMNKFELENFCVVDEKDLKAYLNSIPELNGTNNVTPQNAYIRINEAGVAEVVPEVYGNEISFEEAYEFALKAIRMGDSRIDLSKLAKTQPEIFSNNQELQDEVQEINHIFGTSILVNLFDKTQVAFDARSFITEGEHGITLDKEASINNFLERIYQGVENIYYALKINATGLDKALSLPVVEKPVVNGEAMRAEIETFLLEGGNHEIEPIYQNTIEQNSYVELDITRQKVWLYVNGACVLESPCVTGNVNKGNGTPTGTFFLSYKERNATLEGEDYSSFVGYWMPFNGGIGFHDATWRKEFGGNIYLNNGSHGCVNLPLEKAKVLYQYISKSMPIIVYAS